MKITPYIIIKRTGQYVYNRKYTSRMTVGSPALASNEIAIKLSLEVPDAIFDKPALEAKITIPEEAVSKPVISAETIDNVQDLIKQNLGFEVKLEVVTPEEEEK